jgi:hypothetical protein
MLEQQSWDSDGADLCEVVGNLTVANNFISYTLIVREFMKFQTDVGQCHSSLQIHQSYVFP